MNSVWLVVSALTAGAKAARSEAATPAAKRTFNPLKMLVSGVVDADVTAVEHDKDPDAWQVPLAAGLIASGAANRPQPIHTVYEPVALLGPTVTHDVSPKRSGSRHDSYDETIGLADGAPASWDEGDQP